LTIDLVRADGAALATEMWALEGELGGVWEAIVDVSERQMREEDEQRAAIDDVRNVVGRLAAQLQDVVAESNRQGLLIGEVERAKEQQRAEIAGLKQRVEALEQDNRRLSGANETMRRDLGNMQQELAKLKEEIKRMNMTKVFVPFVKQGGRFGVPNGIVAHLTRKYGGNVHDCHVVEVTSGSFEKETHGANPHSGAYDNCPSFVAKNAADLETDLRFFSAYRPKKEDIPHTRNNWICYDFKKRRIVPTHYTIRTNSDGPGYSHLKSWLVETSVDGENWREVAREEDNEQLNGEWFTATFAVAGGVECHFIRLVNIGRNHGRFEGGDDCLLLSAWEIFGSLIE
jgi:hypothetical protein